MANADLRLLVKQEKQLKTALSNVKVFVDNYQEYLDNGEVELRLLKLDSIFEQFCAIRVKIDVILEEMQPIQSDDQTKDVKARAASESEVSAESERAYREFENMYFRLKSALLSKCPKKAGGVAGPVVDRSHQSSRLKYPELKLPTFSGKLQEWINFRDNFKSLIHNNEDLSTMDKFNYLRASLRDDALLQINQVQVTAATYNIAWNLLETKYENHKMIAQEHLRALFSVPAMKSECCEALNTLLMTFKVNLQQLEKLGQKPGDWSTI